MLLLLLAIGSILLTSCDRRSNLLLPPGLQPEDYLEDSYLWKTANYLIKSSTDDSYLYITKQAFTDGIIKIGDIVYFQKEDNLTARDTLHISGNPVNVTPALSFYIYRNGTWADLTFPAQYAGITIYTDAKSNIPPPDQLFFVSFYWWLDGVLTSAQPYAQGRLSFHPDRVGLFQLLNIANPSADLSFTANAGSHYAWMQGTQDRVSFFLPVTADDTIIHTRSIPELDSTQVSQIQGIYPSFATFSSLIEYSSSQNLGSSTQAPLLKMHNLGLPGRYPLQWLVQTSNQLYAWEQGENTWTMTGNDLIAPIYINGLYQLIVPLESQTSLDIPLDVGLKQVYAEDLWLDTRGANLPGVLLSIGSSDFSTWLSNYFGGNPYTLQSAYSGIDFTFRQNGSVLTELPDTNWVELGWKPSIDISGGLGSHKLFRCFGNSASDIITYKTYASSYDATHYMAAAGRIYASVKQSGTYLLANAGVTSANLNIPVLKAGGEFQTTDAYIYWNNAKRRQFTSFHLGLNPTVDLTHPWLNGEPYSLSNPVAAVQTYFRQRDTPLASVPSVFYLSYRNPSAQAFSTVLNFSNLEDWNRAELYTAGSSADADHYVNDNGWITLYPVCGGILFQTDVSNLTAAAFHIRLYNQMSIDFDRLKLWMQSDGVLETGSRLDVNVSASPVDSLNILATQYNLSPLSPCYTLSVSTSGKASRAFFDEHAPLVYLKRNSRRTEYLFTIATEPNCRIYAYEYGDTPDGYQYAVENGYNVFYLVHPGQFISYADNSPHNQISRTLQSNGHDFYLSLYQAEIMLPVYYTNQAALLGHILTLEKLTDFTNLPNPVSACRVSFFDTANQPVEANFTTAYTPIRYPIIYIPFPPEYANQTVNLYFRNTNGVTSQLTQVSLLNASISEFTVYGNCAICFLDNPGIFYLTTAGQ